MKYRKLATLFIVLCGAAVCRAHDVAENEEREAILAATEEMRAAAAAWLETLDDSQRDRAVFAFDGPQRTDWNFVPMDRPGVSLGEMSLDQRRAASDLMRTALSDRGYLKVTAIMSLEGVLRLLEADREGVERVRDPEKYCITVYGDPSADADAPWAWRLEGHHLSLNFTATGAGSADPLASTPLFLGANPAEVRVGPLTGLRVLAEEDDLGRAVMASLDAAQRAAATIATEAPDNVQGVPGVPPAIEGPEGLALDRMNDAQRRLVRDLVEGFARLLRPAAAADLMQEIDAAGFDRLHFSWAGGLATLDDSRTTHRHYFRVHGPTFVLEYDYQEPNHVHAVWHSLADDFGVATLSAQRLETLRRHHIESHGAVSE